MTWRCCGCSGIPSRRRRCEDWIAVLRMRTLCHFRIFCKPPQMSTPLLSPGSADALLFDLGRVVIDIDFSRALACWAGHAGCEPSDIVERFVRDDVYRHHE